MNNAIYAITWLPPQSHGCLEIIFTIFNLLIPRSIPHLLAVQDSRQASLAEALASSIKQRKYFKKNCKKILFYFKKTFEFVVDIAAPCWFCHNSMINKLWQPVLFKSFICLSVHIISLLNYSIFIHLCFFTKLFMVNSVLYDHKFTIT